MRDWLNKTETFLAAVNTVKSERRNNILEGHRGLFGLASSKRGHGTAELCQQEAAGAGEPAYLSPGSPGTPAV